MAPLFDRTEGQNPQSREELQARARELGVDPDQSDEDLRSAIAVEEQAPPADGAGDPDAAGPDAGAGTGPVDTGSDADPAAGIPSPGADPALYDPETVEDVDHDDDANVAEERAAVGARGPGPVEGRVDGMSRRSGREVMQGHFCVIDKAADGVEDALKEAHAAYDRDGYGVYLEPAEVDDEGYPTVALVRLRDDTHAIVRVPYDALSPAAAGAR